jgi:hypothetical protein
MKDSQSKAALKRWLNFMHRFRMIASRTESGEFEFVTLEQQAPNFHAQIVDGELKEASKPLPMPFVNRFEEPDFACSPRAGR